MAGSQKLADEDRFVSARTAAAPKGFFVPASGTFKYGQSVECLTCDINGPGQGNLPTRLLGQVMGWRSNAGPSRILAHGVLR